MDDDAERLLSLATTTAIEAGELLLSRQARSVRIKSSANDLVSDVDVASEELISGKLLSTRPFDGLMGEESGERAGSSGVRWVIDPLDGTGNYLRGIPNFVVSIAAELDGVPLLGVVHDPSRGETFTAVRGHGARRGGNLLSVRSNVVLPRALVSSGYGSDPVRRVGQAAELARILGHVGEIRLGGSAAMDLCWVAAGRVDVYYERDTKVWDRAAGCLIAEEAGALVCGSNGAPGDELVVAGNADLVKRLLQLLAM